MQRLFILKIVDKVIEYVLMALLGAMCFALVLQVVFRYFLNSPLIWSEELARYLFIWITFLGAGYGVRHRLHVEMSIVVNMFSEAGKKATQVATNVIVILAYLYIIPSSYSFMMVQAPIQATTIPISLAFLFAAAPVGCGLLVLSLILDTIEVIRPRALAK